MSVSVPLRSALCLLVWATAAWAADGGTPSVSDGPYCNGAYADDFNALTPHIRDIDRDRPEQYSYCLRSSATYECLAYGADGNVRKTRK